MLADLNIRVTSHGCAERALNLPPRQVSGVDDATLSVVKGAVEAVVAMAGHRMSDMDPELGANLLLFFFEDWDELLETPDLDKLEVFPGVSEFPARVKRASLAWHTLQAAMKGEDETVTTE